MSEENKEVEEVAVNEGVPAAESAPVESTEEVSQPEGGDDQAPSVPVAG